MEKLKAVLLAMLKVLISRTVIIAMLGAGAGAAGISLNPEAGAKIVDMAMSLSSAIKSEEAKPIEAAPVAP